MRRFYVALSPRHTRMRAAPDERRAAAGRRCSVFQERPQLLAAARMPQFPQRLGLDLPDALTGDVELLADFLERVIGVHVDAKAHPEYLRLARCQAGEHGVRGLAQRLGRRRVDRGFDRGVLDEIAEMRILVVADRCLHRDRLFCDLEHLPDLVLGHLHPHRELVGRWFTAHLLQHLPRDAVELVDGLDHVHRDTDGARLVGDRARDGLPDPPGRVGRELVATAVLELVDRLHQADVALLDQVQELQSAVRVLLGDRDHETKVRLDHLLLGATRLRLADCYLAVDVLDLGDRQVRATLGFLEAHLLPLDLFAQARKRAGVLALGTDVLVEPAQVGLVAREGLDEIRAGHARIANAELHDRLLDATDLVQVLAQLNDERIEHAWGEPQLHELVGKPLAQPRGLRFTRALLVEPLDCLDVELRQRRESPRRFLRVRTGLDRFLVLGGFLVAFLELLVHRRFGRELRIDGLRDHIGRVRVVEADDDVDQASLAGLYRLVTTEDVVIGRRVVRERPAHGVEAFLDALRDRDLALAREQLDRSHFAHVHADRVGGAAKLRVDRGRKRRGGFLGGFIVSHHRFTQQQRLGIRRLLVHRDAHVVDHLHDVFDLLRIDDLGRQVIVDFGVGQEALLLAACDQQLQLRLAILGRGGRQTDLELLGAGLRRLAGLATRGDRIELRVDGGGCRRDLERNAGLGPSGWLGRNARGGGRMRGSGLAGGRPGGRAAAGSRLVSRRRLRARGRAGIPRMRGLDRGLAYRGRGPRGGGLACGCFPDLLACRLTQDGRLGGGGGKKERKYIIGPFRDRGYFAGCPIPRLARRSS